MERVHVTKVLGDGLVENDAPTVVSMIRLRSVPSISMVQRTLDLGLQRDNAFPIGHDGLSFSSWNTFTFALVSVVDHG